MTTEAKRRLVMSEVVMKYQDKARMIRENISKVIVGKEEVTDYVLVALLAGGHILLEDVPGTGKTMLAKTFAKSIDAKFSRIQFTPDLLPSDVTGINYYNQKESAFVFREGPIFANIVLADEINRATPRTQSALLECMEEAQVTVDGKTSKLDMPFVVLATQNPIETAGTYQLPEAQLDRFLLKVSMGYLSKADEVNVINRFIQNNPLESVEPVCTIQEAVAMKEEVKNVFVHEAIMNYIVDIVNKTRSHDNVSIGVSTRGTLNMVNAARAYAYIAGRTFVTPEDIKKLAVPVFAHRLVLKHGMTREDNRGLIIEGILSETEVPTEDWDR